MSNDRTQENAQNNEPKVLRDGRLKATLWPNQGEHGPYVSVDVARTYTDKDGKPRDSRGFSVADTLKVSELLREAYPVGRSMEKEMRREQQAERGVNEPRGSKQRGHRQTQEPSR